MATNKLYDVIIVGASKDGLALCAQLLAKKMDIKIAFISKHFNFQSNKLNLETVDKFEQEVVFSSHKRGLFGIYMANKEAVFGKAVVIAVGTKPVKSSLKNANIKYNLSEIVADKRTAAVVYGNDDTAASYAIALAKKFKYVYLCASKLELTCSNKYRKKIENIANIVHLPNCTIVACKNDKNGRLSEVMLDTYSSIRCSTLVMSLGRLPENSGLDRRMLKTDSDGYIITKESCETTEVPNLFAVGSCIRSSSIARPSLVANTILERIN